MLSLPQKTSTCREPPIKREFPSMIQTRKPSRCVLNGRKLIIVGNSGSNDGAGC